MNDWERKEVQAARNAEFWAGFLLGFLGGAAFACFLVAVLI
jgi:hypothetical protein